MPAEVFSSGKVKSAPDSRLARFSVFAGAFLTLGVNILKIVAFLKTYYHLVSEVDDDDSILDNEEVHTVDSLRGVLASCMIVPAATFGLVVRMIIRSLWQHRHADVTAEAEQEHLLAVLPWLLMLTVQASLAVSGYSRAMERWEHIGDDSNGDWNISVDGTSGWTHDQTSWAQLAYRFGYFACAWYGLLWVYLRFIEPKVNACMLAFPTDSVDSGCKRTQHTAMSEHHELQPGPGDVVPGGSHADCVATAGPAEH
eukprot:jgi/Ulvmu1/3465/UM016_0085.1